MKLLRKNKVSKTEICHFALLAVFLFSSNCQSPKPKEEKTPSEVVATDVQSEESDDKKVILFFGNSITAGYQLDLSEAFPAVIGETIDSLGLNYRVVNAGLSGETTASGSTRVDWVLKNPVDIFVLELGANDGLRGIKTEETVKNLQTIVDKVKTKYPNVKIVLAGMQIPPNMGTEYSENFKNVFPDLAEKNGLTLIPFILEGVAGNPDLNLSDGIHPTPEGHRILAKTVWDTISPLL